MQLTRIQRFLNKTDLGNSGKHGAEILLDQAIKIYFDHITKNQVVTFINLEDNSTLQLTKKYEASEKFTNINLKKYFEDRNLQEGDIVEIFILQKNTQVTYYINFIRTNILLFKRNKQNNEYYSLSEAKLEVFLRSNKTNEIKVKFNEKEKVINFSNTSNLKIRKDGKKLTQHFKFDLKFEVFCINLDNQTLREIKTINNVDTKYVDNNIIENQSDLLQLNSLFSSLSPALSHLSSLSDNSSLSVMEKTPTLTEYKKIEANFKPKARLLLQLGDQLIRNEKIALSEIIKNSYDACSKNVKVIMNDIDIPEIGEIIIYDDGFGMDIDILNSVWMEPGTDHKETKDEDNFNSICNRRPIGEKGIGRFGVHKLGNHIELISKKADKNEVVFKIDWNDFNGSDYLSDKLITLKEREATFFTNQTTGTYIRITKLRKEWTKRDFRELYRSAFSLTSPFETKDDFYIDIDTNLSEWKEGLLSLEKVKQYGLWYFECTANDFLDEQGNNQSKITKFKYKFQPYLYMDKAKSREVSEADSYIGVNPYIKREIDKDKQKSGEEKFEFIPFDGIGEVTIKGYIFDFDKDTLDLSDITDRKGLKDFVKQNGGVRVYRDGMRIYDYGEIGNDWLNMDASRINAPTAKIANRNIISSIYIKGKDSKGLIEQTNREGFIENSTYYNFKDIVTNILNKVNFLKNEDKDKFRTLYAKEKDSTKDTMAIIEKTKNKIDSYITDESKKTEVINLIEKIEVNYNSVKDIVLKSSGAGLAYSLVMHEVEKMVDSLKNTVAVSKEFESIQELVLHLSKSIESISSLLNNDKVDNTSLTQLAIKAIVFFRRRLNKHNIELVIRFDDKKDIYTKCLNNLTVNAIMNLIDNSAYWLKYNYKVLKNRKILIDIIEKENSIELIVADTGLGFAISEDTAKLPFKTTKQEGLGKGLGLYFVNEIMNQNSGTLKILTNKDYKTNTLHLPEEFLDGATVALEFTKVIK